MKDVVLILATWIRRFEDALLATLLGVMVVLAVGQIVQRNLLGSGFVWTDEFLRILVLWLTLVGAIVASRADHHIRMDVVLRLLPATWQRHVRRLIFAATAAICFVLSWHAGQFVLIEAEFGSVLLGGYPSWWFQGIIPVGFGLIGCRYLVLTLHPQRAEEAVSPAGEMTC